MKMVADSLNYKSKSDGIFGEAGDYFSVFDVSSHFSRTLSVIFGPLMQYYIGYSGVSLFSLVISQKVLSFFLCTKKTKMCNRNSWPPLKSVVSGSLRQRFFLKKKRYGSADYLVIPNAPQAVFFKLRS